MKCDELKVHIDDFILDEAEPQVEILVNEHLLECEACRREVEARETLYAGLRAKAGSGPPETAYQRIKQALKTPGAGRRPFYAHWTFRAAALAATFFLGMVLMRGVDVVSLRKYEKPAVETGTRPYNRTPYADTVKFYSAPAKNLAKI